MCAVLSAVVVLLAMGAPGARAEVPAAVEENMDGVVQFVQRQVTAADEECDWACTALYIDSRAPTRPATKPAGVRGVINGLLRAAVDKGVSSRPIWLDYVGRVPVYGALVVGNYYVWRYVIDGVLGNSGVMRLPVAQEIHEWMLSDGASPQIFPTFFDQPSPLPVGYVASGGNLGTVLWQTSTNADPGCNVPAPPIPAGMAGVVQEISWLWNECEVWPHPNLFPVYAHTWVTPLSDVFPSFGSGEQPPEGAETIPLWPNTTVTPEDIEQRVRDVLNAPDQDFNDLRDWLDSVLGGPSKNPRYTYGNAPPCAGASVSTCTARFRDAGFTGTITTKTLSQDEAVMEAPAGSVTGASPGEALDAVIDTDVTIYVNPATMPQMTQEEALIASLLKQNNPTVGDDPETGENKVAWDTIARTCARSVKAIGRQALDCTTLPIFVTGNDADKPAENDRDAIERRGAWALLHNRVQPAKKRWYANPDLPPCTQDKVPETMLNPECDEYPFWATLEAHDGAFNKTSDSSYLQPSLMWTARKENGRQGGALRHFFSTDRGGSGPNSYPFNGCGIPAQDEAAPALVGAAPGARELIAAPSQFLNVPLGGHVRFKTIGLCNKPSSTP